MKTSGGPLGWLDKLDWRILGFLALMLAAAPWPGAPEPHLVEKIKMLFAGNLTEPIDIFDLLMHGTPLTILLIKIGRMIQLKFQK